MTNPPPDHAYVLAQLDELRKQAQSTGARVSVLALARKVGLANTTFRRRFPDLVAKIADQEPPSPNRHAATAPKNAEPELRQRNRDLRENLEYAMASIQRLTLENQRLRNELESVQTVTSIRPTQRPPTPPQSLITPGSTAR
ncbi:hypothetical protein Rhow_004491 [Rhodococcus wratislaviensis]|uniref:Uncharacterized protein n=1 Tax=Rhodococcus wratislaviensis TaxID=44752 RepID=A0A402CB77_RHOWR|nr:hypothetical protein [Rhodococcus wratislaviensis]GCE40848.1 hypothetical protein Rhow_004491 [Rhodococcus wratislaviensis]